MPAVMAKYPGLACNGVAVGINCLPIVKKNLYRSRYKFSPYICVVNDINLNVMANTLYQTKSTVTGGRNGKVQSEDGVLNLELRIPKEMGGPGGSYTNPEQLFSAGYAACFDSALNFVAAQQKIKLTGTRVTATVGLEKADPGFKLTAALDVAIMGIPRDQAQKLLETAHQVCPYSNALRNNVDVKLTLLEEEY